MTYWYRQSNIKVLHIQLETWTSRRNKLCKITAYQYVLPAICSLLSLDYLNRFFRSSHGRCSVKKRNSWKSHKFHRNTPVLESLLIKWGPATSLKKETPTQIFSCKICEIFKNTYIEMDLCTPASDFPNPAYSFSSLLGNFYPLQYQQITK